MGSGMAESEGRNEKGKRQRFKGRVKERTTVSNRFKKEQK